MLINLTSVFSSLVHVVLEFRAQTTDSPFGQALRQHVSSLESQGFSKPDFLSEISYMDPSKYSVVPTLMNTAWYDASRVTQSMGSLWSAVTWTISMWDYLPQIVTGDPAMLLQVFDTMWYQTDLTLWNAAKQLDRPGESGRVAKEYGLVDPNRSDRPTFFKFLLASTREPPTLETTPAPAPSPYVEAIPTAAPTESAVQSGHAYLTETAQEKPKKSKKKTKGVATVDPQSLGTAVLDQNEAEPQGLESFPVKLPSEFKIGKRPLKVRRIHDE